MDHNKKLDFIHKMATLGLKHFDGGGLVGGIGNALGETNNFTASTGLTGQDLQNQYNQANTGVQNSQSLYGQTQPGIAQGLSSQNALAAQLQGVISGTGPNAAQAQLQQNTAANTANTAALMAGQRGSAQNAGLIARQAGQQGAANQQASAGQAATTQAQQQVAAMQNAQNLAATQVSQGQTALNSSNQAAQGLFNGAESASGTANTTNAQTAAANTNTNNGIVSGLASGIGAITGLFAKGGVVKMANGGDPLGAAPTSAGQSAVGDFLSGVNSGSGSYDASASYYNAIKGNNPKPSADPMDGAESLAPMAGGAADAGGISSLAADAGPLLMAAANGGPVRQYSSKGGPVEAETEAEEPVDATGNDYANDKIPAMLSAGEVVMDHETLNDPGTIGHMARAIAAHIEQRNKSKRG